MLHQCCGYVLQFNVFQAVTFNECLADVVLRISCRHELTWLRSLIATHCFRASDRRLSRAQHSLTRSKRVLFAKLRFLCRQQFLLSCLITP